MKNSSFIKTICITLLCCLTGLAQAQKFDSLALTPPMGWNSWNYFNCNVNEEVIRGIADAMVSSGMRDAGYMYIVIDDCWQIDRDADGRIVVDAERFPSGMPALIEYVHSKGLKFGIYSDAGTMTCQERPGSKDHELIDAQTYAAWGVDYLKFDWCHTAGQTQQEAYTNMRDALYKAGRPIVFSICEWGSSQPWLWAGPVGNLWRTTGDISDNWKSMTGILDKQTDLWRYAGPGHWNDPDMLEVGNGGMSTAEYRAHFSLWCMLAAPLMAGNDLRHMSDETRAILTNKKAIAVDQDPLGVQAQKVFDDGNHEIWLRPLQNNTWAVCFFNRAKKDWKLNLDWGSIEVPDDLNIQDLWTDQQWGSTNKPFIGTVTSHDVVMVRLE